jgi:hypothetical protein
MHSVKLLVVMFAYLMVAECLFFDGGLTVAGGGLALAALFGIKAAAVGGFALGGALASRRRSSGRRSYGRSYRRSYGRYGRSVEDEDESSLTETLLEASRNDADDCAKKVVCALNAMNAMELAEDEKAIVALFGQNESIDVTAVTVEFDLAALMGQKAGAAQCSKIYSRCRYEAKDLMEAIRQPNVYSNEI